MYRMNIHDAYLPTLSRQKLNTLFSGSNSSQVYEQLAAPLHEELYRRGDFNFLDVLSTGQQLLLSYDYVRMQTLQGGFIQLLHNGYVGLLPDMPAWLKHIGDEPMAQLIDDVLKVYVLNHTLIDKQTTPEEFARLYDELKEFEILDERFRELDLQTVDRMVTYAKTYPEQFFTLI